MPATGLNAKAICQRCGLPLGYQGLVRDGNNRNLWVHSRCRDDESRDKKIARRFLPPEEIALDHPSPDTSDGGVPAQFKKEFAEVLGVKQWFGAGAQGEGGFIEVIETPPPVGPPPVTPPPSVPMVLADGSVDITGGDPNNPRTLVYVVLLQDMIESALEAYWNG